jgi:tetratricopeptide (TPR) repeat protein
MQETFWSPFFCRVQRDFRQIVIQIGYDLPSGEMDASQSQKSFHEPVTLPLETWEYICDTCKRGQLPPLITCQQRTILLVMAETLHERDQDQLALELLAHIDQDHPFYLVAQFLKAKLCFFLGLETSNRLFFNEADVLYSKILTHLELIEAPSAVIAALYIKWGKTLEELIQLNDALIAYQHAVEIAPMDASQYNLQEALSCALQASQLDPANGEIQLYCAKLLESLGVAASK